MSHMHNSRKYRKRRGRAVRCKIRWCRRLNAYLSGHYRDEKFVVAFVVRTTPGAPTRDRTPADKAKF